MELILIIVVLVLLFGGGGGYWGRNRGFWWSSVFLRSGVNTDTESRPANRLLYSITLRVLHRRPAAL